MEEQLMNKNIFDNIFDSFDKLTDEELNILLNTDLNIITSVSVSRDFENKEKI